MMKSYKRKILTEGMSLDQIKQGLNQDLLGMLNKFNRLIFSKFSATNRIIGSFAEEVLEKIADDEEAGLITKEEGDTKYEFAIKAYTDFVLVNVIENGEPLAPMIDINNPTNRVKGKFTEFVLRILTSPSFKNEIQNWSQITEFLKICKNSNSNLYKSKNAFFDNAIIPLMNDRVAKGEKLGSVNPETGVKGSNFSRPSATSPLQDKVMKVFEAYGVYNGKNILSTILDEVIDENSEQGLRTFAGYDIKLIDYCLSKKYWKEFHVPNQPGSVRLFFIGNGDLESLNLEPDENPINSDDIYEDWLMMDYEEQAAWGGEFLDYYDSIMAEYDHRAPSEMKSFSYYFTLRALIYACNIYPFKTNYNVIKNNSKVSSKEINYFKSISNDDYIIPEHNYDLKIRKTTDWCTKDEKQLSKYIAPKSSHKVEGFILCLNNSLPFDDPDGTLQIGIKADRDDQGNIIGNLHNKDLTLNANDETRTCPSFLNDFFNQNQKGLYYMIDQGKKTYDTIRNLKFPDQENEMSPEEKKLYFEKMQKNNITESLLRNYIRQLLK